MKRLYAVLASAIILVGLLPAAVSADRVSKGTDHFVFVGCETPIDGGFAQVFLEVSTLNDVTFMGASIWLDPAVPFEMDPTAFGSTDTIDLSDDGTTIEGHAAFPTFDVNGDPTGDAELTVTMARTGDVFLITPETGKTNNNDRTSGMEEGLSGSATLTWDGTEVSFPECEGIVGDVTFFQTNPRAFVTANTGVQIDCFWETESGVAGLFAVDDGFGFFGDASLVADGLELFSIDSSGSLGTAGMNIGFELEDGATGDAYSAAATAAFTPNGSPVTSTYTSEAAQTKATEQALVPDGTLEFSTGASFPIDDEHCNAFWFDTHTTSEPGAGPKGGPAPSNDSPEGAIPLHVGSRLNASTVAASPEPEIQLQNCPEGFLDHFGNTLWYTIEGTGSPITIDTAGSNFDTLIAVYLPTDTGFDEIACIDDVEFEPIGATFQAALTFDTDEGVTYYVQIGGYDFPFDDEVIGQKGRLRVRVQ